MEYFAPAKGAPSSFAPGQLEQSPAPAPASGVQGIPFYDEWQRHGVAQPQPQQRSPRGGGLDAAGGDSVSEGSAKFRDCVCVARDIALG
jgi:hypothetical protein